MVTVVELGIEPPIELPLPAARERDARADVRRLPMLARRRDLDPHGARHPFEEPKHAVVVVAGRRRVLDGGVRDLGDLDCLPAHDNGNDQQDAPRTDRVGEQDERSREDEGHPAEVAAQGRHDREHADAHQRIHRATHPNRRGVEDGCHERAEREAPDE